MSKSITLNRVSELKLKIRNILQYSEETFPVKRINDYKSQMSSIDDILQLTEYLTRQIPKKQIQGNMIQLISNLIISKLVLSGLHLRSTTHSLLTFTPSTTYIINTSLINQINRKKEKLNYLNNTQSPEFFSET